MARMQKLYRLPEVTVTGMRQPIAKGVVGGTGKDQGGATPDHKNTNDNGATAAAATTTLTDPNNDDGSTETPTHGLRPMTEADIPSAHKLVTQHLRNFSLAVVFSKDEFRHWFLPRPDVISNYVITKPDSPNDVTNLISFCLLSSAIIGNPKYSF